MGWDWQVMATFWELEYDRPSLNPSFAMGLRLGNGISPYFFSFREVEYDRPYPVLAKILFIFCLLYCVFISMVKLTI